MPTIDVAALAGNDMSVEDVMKILSRLRAAEAAAAEVEKKRREEMREHLLTVVPDIITLFGTRTMESGAVGQSIGGTITVEDPDTGKPREMRVSMLMRWVDTIPKREPKKKDEKKTSAKKAAEPVTTPDMLDGLVDADEVAADAEAAQD